MVIRALDRVLDIAIPRAGAPGRVRFTERQLFHEVCRVLRMLLCQHRGIAAMLLANDLHMEAECLVFALADLPLDPRLLAALGRADGATVYVLHDASAGGVAVPDLVRRRLEPARGVRLVPLGLLPRHAASLHLTAGRGPADHGPVPDALDRRERGWLGAGRFAEVAAVQPARLLRTLLRLMCEDAPGPRDLPWLRDELRRARGTGFMSRPVP